MLYTLPSFLLDLLLLLSLGGSIQLLFATPLPAQLFSLFVFRLGLALCLLRASVSGEIGSQLLSAVGASLPPLALAALLLVTALVLGVVLARALSRSAEVAARMALDALPAAQAALEADLRGQSDPLLPSVQRARLLEETQRLGGLDGAARVVSGDAMLAVLLGVSLWLALWAQGSSDASAQGLGLTATHLAAALPASVAMLGRQSLSRRAAAFSTALFLLLLCFLPESPWYLVLPVSVFFAAQGIHKKRSEQTFSIHLPNITPETHTKLQQQLTAQEQALGVKLPRPIVVTDKGSPMLRQGDQVVARGASLAVLLRQLAALHFGVEESSHYLRQLAINYPAASRSIRQPFSQIVLSLQHLVQEGYPLQQRAIAEVLALSAASLSQAELEEKLRQVLLAGRLALLGAQPWRTLRASSALEFELRSNRSITGTQRTSLEDQLQQIDVVIGSPESRRALAVLLQHTSCAVLCSRDLPSDTELLFLGELSLENTLLR